MHKNKTIPILVFIVHQIAHVKIVKLHTYCLKLHNADVRAVLITITKCPSIAVCNVANTMLINS